MKVIYVAGKYRGESEREVFDNIIHARSAALKLWNEGWAVICPHTNCMFMGSQMFNNAFMEGDLEILKRCDAIYLLEGFIESVGAVMELGYAQGIGLEILYEHKE